MLNENTLSPPLVITIASESVHVVPPKDCTLWSACAKPSGAARRWRRVVGSCEIQRRRPKMTPCGRVV
jgi:hypothetical protein